MTSFVFRRAAMALAVASAFPFVSAHAAETSVDEVLVTAARFNADPAFAPIGANVITAAQIREAGVGSVNEALRKIGGVYGRQSLNGSADYSLDLRGFGQTGEQNMVIMIDGVRLSENELASAKLSGIPVDSVQRIEIVRGGSSVLYGEGATGGVINIVTTRARNNETRGSVFAEAGNYGHREVRGSIAQGWNGFSADANLSAQRADNYRDNNETKQKNFSGGLQWATADTRVGARADISRQDAGLPGPLTLDQYDHDPRQTTSPNDYASYDTDRYTLFAEQRWAGLEAAAELSRRETTAKAAFLSSSGDYFSTAKSRTTQFSPRVRHLSTAGDVKNELVAGFDFQRWNRDSDSSYLGSASPTARSTQKSRAFYLRDEVRIGNARIAAGGRHESFDKTFSSPGGWGTTAYDKSQSVNAWELQGSYAFTPSVLAFAKVGRSYRVANADENAATLLPDMPLEPQTSRDTEIGATFGSKRDRATIKLFRQRLRNEILYNPTFFSNVNLDPTRRTGAEFDGSMRVANDWNVSAHLQHVSVDITEGPSAGKEVTLVPRNTATVRVTWVQETQSTDLGLRWVDSQRYGNDFSNACSARIPAYTLLDGRIAQRFGGWEVALTGSNLTDRRYFSNAFGDCRNGIYTDPGRQLKLSARYQF